MRWPSSGARGLEKLAAAPQPAPTCCFTFVLLPRDLHDLEAFLTEVVLYVGQVVLGLFGGKIRGGKSLENFLGGDEAALPAPCRDGLRGLVQADRLVDRGYRRAFGVKDGRGSRQRCPASVQTPYTCRLHASPAQ